MERLNLSNHLYLVNIYFFKIYIKSNLWLCFDKKPMQKASFLHFRKSQEFLEWVSGEIFRDNIPILKIGGGAICPSPQAFWGINYDMYFKKDYLFNVRLKIRYCANILISWQYIYEVQTCFSHILQILYCSSKYYYTNTIVPFSLVTTNLDLIM